MGLKYQCLKCPAEFNKLQELVDHCKKEHGLILDKSYQYYLDKRK